MIVDWILNIFISLGNMIIDKLPVIQVGGIVGLVTEISSIGVMVFRYIGFFLPVGDILRVLGLTIILNNLELAAKIIWRVKSFIPTMGK